MVIRWCPRCLRAESAELRLSKKKSELLNVVSRTSPFRSGDIAAFIIGRRVWGDKLLPCFLGAISGILRPLCPASRSDTEPGVVLVWHVP